MQAGCPRVGTTSAALLCLGRWTRASPSCRLPGDAPWWGRAGAKGYGWLGSSTRQRGCQCTAPLPCQPRVAWQPVSPVPPPGHASARWPPIATLALTLAPTVGPGWGALGALGSEPCPQGQVQHLTGTSRPPHGHPTATPRPPYKHPYRDMLPAPRSWLQRLCAALLRGLPLVLRGCQAQGQGTETDQGPHPCCIPMLPSPC